MNNNLKEVSWMVLEIFGLFAIGKGKAENNFSIF
jgi:hypothetical protein